MALEQLAQPTAPRRCVDVLWHWLVREKQRKPSLHRSLRSGVLRWLQQRRLFCPEQEHVVHRGVFQKPPHRLAALGHHSLFTKRHTKNLPRIFAQRRRVCGVAQGGRCASTNEVPGGSFESCAQAAQQQGQVGTLGTIKSVQLVHHHIAQRGGYVGGPQLAVLGPQHQVVEHLVVGQQDVGRVLAQGVAVSDDGALGHHHAFARCPGVSAHIQPHAQPGKRSGGRHQLGNAARLVGGQCIHGVDDQGLHARFARRAGAGAVVQHRVQKALCLTAARTSGHQSAHALAVTRQPLPCVLLVAETRVCGLERVKERLATFASHKWQAHLHIRAFEPRRLVIYKAAHQSVVEGVGGLEGRNQKLLQGRLYVVGE